MKTQRNRPSSSRPVVLVITGAPASGKTTVGRQLARELGWPYLSKDFSKETLFDALGWEDRAWSKRVGAASMRLLYKCSEVLLEAGKSLAVESNFYSQWDTPLLKELQQRYGCQFVQVLCTAQGSTLLERFERRATAGERHPGHRDHLNLDEFRPVLLSGRWDPVAVDGPCFTVDTTDFTSIDYDALRLAIVAELRA